MIRVLQIGMTNTLGGIESYLINYYRQIDKKQVQFDFLNIYESGLYFSDEIIKLGGHIINVPNYYKHPIKYIKVVKKFILENHYDIIHCNMNSAVMLFPLIAAKMAKSPIIIAHAHNNSSDKGIIKSLMHNINRLFVPFLANFYFACSISAAEWFFKKKIINSDRFYIINNPVDFNSFSFDQVTRKEKRKELNINDDDFVIGHVGRFAKPKNHIFLIDIFKEYVKLNSHSKLLLIGAGELQDIIKAKVNSLNLEKKVLFLNNRNDVNDLMCAMDFFVFPSLYEGLGIVLIEAQANGLPILTSDNIPKEVEINSNFYRKKISDCADKWALQIQELPKNRCTSISNYDFDIKNCVDKLVSIYNQILNDGGTNEHN